MVDVKHLLLSVAPESGVCLAGGGGGEVKNLKQEKVLVRGKEREVLIEQQSLLPLWLETEEIEHQLTYMKHNFMIR